MNKKVINIINESQDLDYIVGDNEIIVINYIANNAENININIIQNNNSQVFVNLSCLSDRNCNININCSIDGDHNKNIIKMRCLSVNGHINSKVCVTAKKNTLGNEILEDLKGINEEGTICFEPILEVDTNEVNAQHFATVGSYDQNELFYLQTKGLSIETAKSLLKNCFLYNLFNKDLLKVIKEGKDNDE